MKRVSIMVGVLVVVLVGPAGVRLAAQESSASENPQRVDLSVRYGIKVDLKRYPQRDPQTAVRSLAQVTAAGEIEYMLAHLISPSQVDAKFEGNRQKLKAMAERPKPGESGRMVDSLNRHLDDGAWLIWRNLAWSHAQGVMDLSLEKIGNRWFMHNTPMPRP